jgi:hypothetical protein
MESEPQINADEAPLSAFIRVHLRLKKNVGNNKLIKGKAKRISAVRAVDIALDR